MLHRDYQLADLEVRGRTLVLACVPFDTPTWVADSDGEYREVFRRGAFEHLTRDPGRTQLRYQHSTDLLDRLGQGVELREDPTYLVGSFRVTAGDRGDHLLDLVASDELRGVSIGFEAGQSQRDDTPDGPLVQRLRVKRLPEVSLVDQPAYPEARVLAVRAERELEQAREAARAFVAQMRAFV
jgi:HK97 family phage prohead protease